MAKTWSETLILLYQRLNETELVSLTEKVTVATHLGEVRQTLPRGREEEVAFQPASLPSNQAKVMELEAEESSLLTVILLMIQGTTLKIGTRWKTR